MGPRTSDLACAPWRARRDRALHTPVLRLPGLVQAGGGRPGRVASDRSDVQRIGSSALFQIEVSYPRRAFAVSLLETAHDAANALLREQALDRIGSQIGQVETELAAATAPTPTRKQALEALLTEVPQSQALLQTDQPYAAQVVVPASAGTAPSSLNPLLALALAAVVGGTLGIFLVFLRDALRSA